MSVNSVSAISLAVGELNEELSDLLAYPKSELCAVIKEVGFKCNLCGKCCTKEYNDHVFLLNRDLERAREKYPSMIIPAPYFEICDQNGSFYVSGYALKVKENGDCAFLDENHRCTIYNDRFSICRLYPYMLHREADEDGKIEWRQISGLNDHGEYNTEISDEECEKYADMTMDYETAFLTQERDFYAALTEHFKKNSLRPIRKIYDDKMRAFVSGEKIKVFVFNGESFEENSIVASDYISSEIAALGKSDA